MKKFRAYLGLTALLLAALLLVSCSSSDGPAETGAAPEETEAAEEVTAEETAAVTTEAEPEVTEEEKKQMKTNPHDPDFYILYTDGDVDLSAAPKGYIDIYTWGDSYTPTAYGQIVFKEGDGFYVRLECEETEVRAVNTETNSNICQDSCMEFFAIYDPANSKKYINIEMNPIGAYLAYFCDSIKSNKTMLAVTDIEPQIAPFKTDSSWGVELYVPLTMLKAAYGDGLSITEGSTILMNMYKCGDKTDKPHWGAWSKVSSDSPNFHLPEYFSEVEIRR